MADLRLLVPLVVGIIDVYIGASLNKKRTYNLVEVTGYMMIAYGIAGVVANLLFPSIIKMQFGVNLDEYYHPHYDAGVRTGYILAALLILLGFAMLWFSKRNAK